MPILTVSDLTVRRGDVSILEGVSWQIQAGEQWVILGPNGCGKTSLLSALTGYLTPTLGQVEVLGQTYGRSDWRELRRRVGLVSSAVRQMIPPDETSLETVIGGKYAMIGYWGKIQPTDRERGLRLLGQTGCIELAERPWLYLSQGERQRILIARALMAKPALLILDEPCAGLDLIARERFLEFLQELGKNENAPALVLVTHHVEEIIPVFSHVLLLREGRVTSQGAKHETLTSQALSDAFGARLRLRSRRQRYALMLDDVIPSAWTNNKLPQSKQWRRRSSTRPTR